MLWVHGHYKYFITYGDCIYTSESDVERVNFTRLAYDSAQIVYLIFAHLTSIDVRF